MQLDRTQAPDFRTIESVQFPTPQVVTLDNGRPLYVVNVGEQPVVRLEVLFEAGTWHEQTEGASFFTIKMLTEGTKNFSSAQISGHFDKIGAFVDLSHTPDRANVMVYGLTKHLGSILEMVSEMLQEATFPEKEFNDLRNITLQNLRINLEKNAYVATHQFKKHLFGTAHPYGRSQNEATIKALLTSDLQNFYHQRIKGRPFRVFLSGQVGEKEIALVNQFLGQQKTVESILELPSREITPQTEPLWLEKEGAVQSSIRVGRRLFKRQHPDFYRMIVANEILGGYFGSRLMKNIREDKGFTYGISASLVPMRQEGYWVIGTDVKKEFAQVTLDEVQKEITSLQNELVPADELEVVKNYMAGEFAGSLNTPFEIADRVRLMVLEGLDVDFYSNYIQRLRVVTAEEIQNMAREYWQWNELQRVIVG
ncbi:pitrilysin family protein [Runella sp. MFBS21]|uniref:M16 family metallopeptidase n=1 Tax=Runella sp. MFBS21 TaxID=3034018 RepID=UPI0023F6B53A|nr:pitrilysin family protein [Runella sp. MFBS21]MDF7820495.1 pitrilysin family protein [Runella sp. MFBS21]